MSGKETRIFLAESARSGKSRVSSPCHNFLSCTQKFKFKYKFKYKFKFKYKYKFKFKYKFTGSPKSVILKKLSFFS